MALAEISVAAAVAVVGYNLLQNSPHRQSRRPRRLRSIALCGSAAAGDTEIQVLIGTTEVARKFNTTTGFPTGDHFVRVGRSVPPGEEVHAIVTDAPATNPINLIVDFEA